VLNHDRRDHADIPDCAECNLIFINYSTPIGPSDVTGFSKGLLANSRSLVHLYNIHNARPGGAISATPTPHQSVANHTAI
jgi:hypothetical protein